MSFSAQKMHFFDKNGNLTPCPAQPSADVKELFFREAILQQFLKRKIWALLGKNVQAILTLLNLAQKVPFLEDLKKKFPRAPHLDRAVWIRSIQMFESSGSDMFEELDHVLDCRAVACWRTKK